MLWRLIPSIAASGEVQMAIDAWLFQQHVEHKHPPTLRFYTWKPIAISLGYHQRRYPEHWQTLTWKGQPLDLVRRSTGGRAVLHQGDLTYAVVTSGLPLQRMQAYRYICEFLVRGWRSLDVELFYGSDGQGYIGNSNCFGTATAADLVLSDGSKLIGSAQLRRGDGVLQHGSMRLNQSAELFLKVFGTSLQRSDRLPPIDSIETEQLIQALTAAAQECFDAEFKIKPLSEEEWQSVLRLVVERQIL